MDQDDDQPESTRHHRQPETTPAPGRTGESKGSDISKARSGRPTQRRHGSSGDRQPRRRQRGVGTATAAPAATAARHRQRPRRRRPPTARRAGDSGRSRRRGDRGGPGDASDGNRDTDTRRQRLQATPSRRRRRTGDGDRRDVDPGDARGRPPRHRPADRRDRRATDRRILALAVPAFGALVAEPLFLLADSAIVGRLGTVELAGLGVAGAVLSSAVGLFVFLAYGTTSLVARRIGAQDTARRARARRRRALAGGRHRRRHRRRRRGARRRPWSGRSAPRRRSPPTP